ncbi:hypothetical protein FB451DRAFT_1175126 [Mycena latifolia]|nr:hypothetical protein FB451DRAFT_1175126 [Mycena latifolia]
MHKMQFSQPAQFTAYHRDTAKKTYVEQFSDIPLIDTSPIQRVVLDSSVLLTLPCAACIFFCVDCVHMGFGVTCINCNKMKVRCEDCMTVLEHIKFYQELTDNHAIASDVTHTLYQEFLDSYRRLREATTVYQSASQDFSACFGKFLRHINVCVEEMGADNLLRRFTKANDGDDDIIKVVNCLLDHAKVIGAIDKAAEEQAASD